MPHQRKGFGLLLVLGKEYRLRQNPEAARFVCHRAERMLTVKKGLHGQRGEVT